ncbi:MAG: serine/threonine-protein kinase, partial [Verrucomicrobiota bacterium]
MSDPNESSEESLFQAALEKSSPEERAAFLDVACRDNPALRARLEMLLEGFFKAEGFLPDQPAGQEALVPVTEKPGDRIGRYKLREKIGEGGCGVVYVAEQEEPVRRKVALKVIKLGMDTKNVIARFEAERQALAMMDHPNIAKVLDAGATETGRPYFVMELVRGIKITDYCDQNRLSTPERLELFIKVCQAVQHAHQKGIIHRDLKPSNILVTVNDPGSPGVPKVIDFGIAKATEGRLTDLTVYTDLHQFIGTPAYMSPEQATMTSLDIDTRSDIYSLGVLLYELLTGHTPFDTKELMALGAEDLRRTIREKEPVRPSTRLSTMLEGELSTTAKQRASEPPRLIHQVRGDLDWIVMKALEKDRTRRYDSANGLAADLHRHLHNELVVACPPSMRYRLRKTVQRHKTAFATAAMIAAVLILGAVASLSEAIRATRAERDQSRLRAAAQQEAAKSEQVAQFLKDMLKGVGPSVARGRDTRLLREILDQTAQRLDRELKGQPAVAADLLETLSAAYVDSGDFTNALDISRKALALRQTLYGKEHPDVAASLYAIGQVLESLDRVAESEACQRQALAMRKKLLGPTNLAVAQSLGGFAWVLMKQNRDAEAETNLNLSLAMRQKLPGGEDLEFVQTLSALGASLRGQGRLSEAEAALRRALAIHAKLHAYEYPTVVDISDTLGWILKAQGKPGEAEAAFRKSLEISRAALDPGHPHLRYELAGLAWSLLDQGKFAEAEAPFREALAITKKVRGEHDPDVAALYDDLGRALEGQDKLPEAEQTFREAIQAYAACNRVGQSEYFDAMQRIGDILAIEDKPAEAGRFSEETLAQERAALSETNVLLAFTLAKVANFLTAQNQTNEAGGYYREALDIASKASAEATNAQWLNDLAWGLVTMDNPTSWDGAVAVEIGKKAVAATDRKDPGILDTLAAAYSIAGQFTNAVRVEQEAMALSETQLFADCLKLYQSNLSYPCRDHDRLAKWTLTRLVEGKYAEAESLARECLAVREIVIPDDWRTFNARSLLGGSLLEQRKYQAAEPLLLSGYEGLKQREDEIP